jgi:ornithine cyclodeaminase
VLSRADVLACVDEIDVVDVVRRTLADHDRGRCVLPDESYLRWRNSAGSYTRSIGMPGGIMPDDGPAQYGMKIINASVSNPTIGLERAGGIGLCFDPETARITTIIEVGLLSALRTAAVTAVGVDVTGYSDAERLSVIGCGMQGGMHVFLLLRRLSWIRRVTLFDRDPAAAEQLATRIGRVHGDVDVTVATSTWQATSAGDIVIVTTTADEPYLEPDWISTGALVANVSLGDLTDAAFLAAGALYVDDVDLIAANPRRPLGRLLREGRIALPGHDGSVKRIDATLGGLLNGRATVASTPRPYVVLNPFGMGVLDVALLAAVRQQADVSAIGVEIQLG